MANAARIAALQLLSAVGAPVALVAARRADIEKGLKKLKTEGIPAHSKYFAAKAELISSRFNKEKTLEQRRQGAKRRLDGSITRLKGQLAVLVTETDRQRRISVEAQAPLSLAIEVYDGQVVRAFVVD